MEAGARVEGLDAALKAMQAAFPRDAKKQKQILNSSMRASANKAILPAAKRNALQGDGSGALSEALGIRNTKARKLRQSGVPAGVEIVPVRANMKAMALYIAHYYTAQGRTPPAGILSSGIRHGHLVEFGSVNNSAQPFLWPAASSGHGAYVRGFAAEMQKKTEAAVRREARKRVTK